MLSSVVCESSISRVGAEVVGGCLEIDFVVDADTGLNLEVEASEELFGWMLGVRLGLGLVLCPSVEL